MGQINRSCCSPLTIRRASGKKLRLRLSCAHRNRFLKWPFYSSRSWAILRVYTGKIENRSGGVEALDSQEWTSGLWPSSPDSCVLARRWWRAPSTWARAPPLPLRLQRKFCLPGRMEIKKKMLRVGSRPGSKTWAKKAAVCKSQL